MNATRFRLSFHELTKEYTTTMFRSRILRVMCLEHCLRKILMGTLDPRITTKEENQGKQKNESINSRENNGSMKRSPQIMESLFKRTLPLSISSRLFFLSKISRLSLLVIPLNFLSSCNYTFFLLCLATVVLVMACT